MRSSWKVAVAVGLLVLPQLAAASDVEEQLLQMQERMNQLEEKLTATTDQLADSQRRAEQQQQLIERAGLEERAASSGIASFFEQVEFGGWVAASYWYNTNEPSSGSNVGAGSAGAGGFPNQGTFSTANPFHPDHQTFQLDQLWFEMAKPATEESRGGFAADLVFGKTADLLTGSTTHFVTDAFSVTNVTSNGNAVAVYQAYAEWLAPIGPGVSIKGGRFATHVGAEVAQTAYNFNITRGLVYSVLQPINHVGVWASTEMDNGFTLGLGVGNTSLQNLNSDVDNDKAYLWHLGYAQDAWSIALNGLYGGDNTINPGGGKPVGYNRDRTGLADLVLTWDPSENLSTWVDVTYVWVEGNSGSGAGSRPWAIGTALAGRLAVTEATGFALRGEYLTSNDNFLLTGPAPGSSQDLWSLTGTVDHALTENLMVKGEVRYEEGSQAGTNKVFYTEGGATPVTNNQVLLGVEMTYRF